MKKVTKTVWITNDGKEFDSKRVALCHEFITEIIAKLHVHEDRAEELLDFFEDNYNKLSEVMDEETGN